MMNAALLVDLLLELNVLNPQDLKREVMRMAAHVSEPRARQWFKRMVVYWLINIDKLMATPYRAKAEPRTIRGSKYSFDPSGKWIGSKVPEHEPASPGAHVPASPEFCPHVNSAARVCPICKGEGSTYEEDPKTGARDSNTGEKCKHCQGTGRAFVPDCPLCVPKGAAQLDYLKQRSLTVESLVARLLEEDPPYPPDPIGTYTSMLHQPDIEKQIGQNFSRFEKPSPATTWLPGQPPTKAKTPAWATPDKELYHFDPIQVRRRELFERLESLVDYLNWQHHLAQQLADPAALEQAKAQALEQAGEEGVQEVMSEQEQAMQAKELFRTLETMKTEDINGFRQVMRDAQDFGRMMVEKPWVFTKDAQVIARQGNFKIIKVRTVDTAVGLSKRKADPTEAAEYPVCNRAERDREALQPVWCTRVPGHATNYINDGPLYFVDKNGFPYVLMHFKANQCKNLDDLEIDRAIAQEIAPVVAANPTEFPLDRFQAGTQGFGALRTALAGLQRRR